MDHKKVPVQVQGFNDESCTSYGRNKEWVCHVWSRGELGKDDKIL